MAEVQLGRLASERASDAEVKAFGQMMVNDHSQANAELKQVASQLNVPVATQLDQKHRDLAERLSKLTGATFDREYMAAMVEGHQEVAAKLRTHAGTVGSASVGQGAGSRTSTSSSGSGGGSASSAGGGSGRGTSSSSGGATSGSGQGSTAGGSAVGGGAGSTAGSDADRRSGSGAESHNTSDSAAAHGSGNRQDQSRTAAGGGVQALNQWASKTLPTVQQHLQRAQVLRQKVSKS